MEIRYLDGRDDHWAVSRIYEESWKYAYRGLIPQEYLDSIPAGRWVQSMDSPGRYHLGLFDGARPVGTACFCASRFAERTGWGEIVSLYLLPETIGKGCGRQLLERAVSELEKLGFSDIFLWVLEGNRRAMDFYERRGFARSGRHREDSIGGRTVTELEYCRHIGRTE